MQEIFEKIKERLERERDIHIRAYDVAIQTHERAGYASYARACDEAIEIVNQVAEEYGKDINVPGNDGWIPSKQFMPAELGEDWVQVQIQERDTGFLWIPRTAEYRGDKWWLTDSDEPLEDVFEVTAWRKLPPYYQPKGEEQ